MNFEPLCTRAPSVGHLGTTNSLLNTFDCLLIATSENWKSEKTLKTSRAEIQKADIYRAETLWSETFRTENCWLELQTWELKSWECM